MEDTIIVSRHGDNLFATGLFSVHGALHLVPALVPDERVVDCNRRFYLHAEIRGRRGIRVEIRRYMTDEVVRQYTTPRSTARIAIARRSASC